MSEKRLLLTGASGQLGRAIHTSFKANGWTVIPLAFSRAKDGMLKVDLRQPKEVEAVVTKHKPTLVLHTAAQRFPDKVDSDYDEAIRLNVTATDNLVSIANKRNIPLLFISTDYVFDGKKPPYKPEDFPNPLNRYGETKLLGERAAITDEGEGNTINIVLRVPVLYGPVEYLDESAVTCLMSLVLDTTKPQQVSDYELRYPCHVNDIASVCLQLADLKVQKPDLIKGTFHWSGEEALTKYKMAVAMANAFGLSHSHLSPNPKPTHGPTARPYDTRLDVSKTKEVGVIVQHTPFATGIKSCLEKWVPK